MMSHRMLMRSLTAVWAALWLGSFAAFALTGPSGDGFARGLNRVMAFLGWQLAAGFLGGVIWLAGRRAERSPAARRLQRVPMLLALLLAAAIAGLILTARFGKPSAPVPPPDAPAATAVPKRPG